MLYNSQGVYLVGNATTKVLQKSITKLLSYLLGTFYLFHIFSVRFYTIFMVMLFSIMFVLFVPIVCFSSVIYNGNTSYLIDNLNTLKVKQNVSSHIKCSNVTLHIALHQSSTLPSTKEGRQIINKKMEEADGTDRTTWDKMSPEEQDDAMRNALDNRGLQKRVDDSAQSEQNNSNHTQNGSIGGNLSTIAVLAPCINWQFANVFHNVFGIKATYRAMSDDSIQKSVNDIINKSVDLVMSMARFILNLLKGYEP